MLKLLNLLFENVSYHNIYDAIVDFLSSSDSNTSTILMYYSPPEELVKNPRYKDKTTNNVAEDFIEQNKNTFNKITKNATQFKFIGAGSYGAAFNLGSYVLKIEYSPKSQTAFSAANRTKESNNALWSNNELGPIVPMIYDHGTLKYYDKEFFWIVMEKFETIKNKDKNTFDIILGKIYSNIKIARNAKDDLENILSDVKYSIHSIIDDITEDYHLESDWLRKLVSHMISIHSSNLGSDFHAGNIGIRRNGAEGYLVFFD